MPLNNSNKPEELTKSNQTIVPPRKLSNAPGISGIKKDSVIASCNYQVEMNQLLEACNYQHPICREFAIINASEDPGTLNIGQICNIYDKISEKWKYVEDPFSGDLLTPASIIMNNKWIGDCEDFSITLAAALIAIGAEVRLVKAYYQDEAHAYLEVNLGSKAIKPIRDYLRKRYNLAQTENLAIRKDELGNFWLNLDWSAEHPGGKYFNQDHGIFFYLNQHTCK